jgi:hypothetical protein
MKAEYVNPYTISDRGFVLKRNALLWPMTLEQANRLWRCGERLNSPTKVFQVVHSTPEQDEMHWFPSHLSLAPRGDISSFVAWGHATGQVAIHMTSTVSASWCRWSAGTVKEEVSCRIC